MVSDSLETLFRELPVGVIVWRLEDGPRPELRLLAANPAASSLLSVTLDGRVGDEVRAVFPTTPPALFDRMVALARGEGGERVFLEGQLTGGARFSISCLPLPMGRVASVIESLKATEAAVRGLQDMSDFLDSIVENIPTMLFVKDAERLRFVRVNKAAEELLGFDRAALVGKTDHDFFPAAQADAFTAKDREVLRGRAVVEIPEEPVMTPTGERWLLTRKIPVLGASGEPRYLLGVSQDITEQRRAQEALRRAHEELEQRVVERTRELAETNAALKEQIEEGRRTSRALAEREEQLRQALKMEAVGRLAGGIAHDFNNLLSVTISYATLFLEEFTADDPRRQDAEAILKAGMRAAELTRQLLAFSRQQILEQKIIDLNAIVAQIERMIRRIIGEDIELVTRLEPTLGRVKVDPGQIEQVLMNLVVNARDAMPSGGKLTIETSNVIVDRSWAELHEGTQPGPHVLLALSDTGVGMDAPTRARIFEPFFTTKEVGKGTGLGLSMVFGIVKQSGGSIFVYSEPGLGTGFKIYLPRAEGVADEASAAAPRAPRGEETILLVEDDEQVRGLARAILGRLGYRVLEAADADEAIRVYDAAPSIDLLLTDVVMPRGSGRSLAQALQSRRPDLPVVFMSGYTDDTVVRFGVLEEGVPFVQKPLTPDVLGHKIREALERRSS